MRAATDISFTADRESGETGRRTRLRIWRRKAWGFKSPLSHGLAVAHIHLILSSRGGDMRHRSLLLSLAAVVACSSDKVSSPTLGPTDANVVGSFSLTSSNGRTLPIVARVTIDEEW